MLLLLSTVLAGPALAQVDLAKSSVTATAKQLGVPIEGKFKKISAVINFNPAQLAQSNAKVEIAVNSYDMGAPEYNHEVLGKDWFNAAQFPTASFVSGAITAAGANKYNVAGKFTLKGKSADVVIPVTTKMEGAAQVFDGALTIKRTQFSVGDGEWKDTSVVADDVVIKFHVVATPAK
jgi:polyisoprenoid-binding protein YceI